MNKFAGGMLIGGAVAAAGIYYMIENKHKGIKVINEGREVLDKAENCLDKVERKIY